MIRLDGGGEILGLPLPIRRAGEIAVFQVEAAG